MIRSQMGGERERERKHTHIYNYSNHKLGEHNFLLTTNIDSTLII
jgi:hypothetical protein